MNGVCSAVYGTVYYREPLKSLEMRVGDCPGFGLPFVAILPHVTVDSAIFGACACYFPTFSYQVK